MTFTKITAILLALTVIVRAIGPCEQHHLYWLNNESHLLGSFEPACDSDGMYSSVQCRGAGCYCADHHGTDLEYYTNHGTGTDVMDCNCARDKTAYERTGMIGRMFFCDSKGSYDSVQCIGSECFCADVNGNEVPNSQMVPIGQSAKLYC